MVLKYIIMPNCQKNDRINWL